MDERSSILCHQRFTGPPQSDAFGKGIRDLRLAHIIMIWYAPRLDLSTKK